MNHVREWAEEYLLTPAWNWASGIRSSWLKSRRVQKTAIVSLTACFLLLAVLLELRTSWLESLVFRSIDHHITYKLEPGPSRLIEYPQPGPYDWTLGYARLPDILQHLENAGYRVEAQARDSHLASVLFRRGVYPVYVSKDQAGLRIEGWHGNSLYSFARPERIFTQYSAIPPLVVDTLLFIENRHMLESAHPFRNPAVEWDRLSRAMLDYSVHVVDHRHAVIGGSTLATQLEKLRHSPGGRTHSPVEKLRQMTSASLAAYRKGFSTLPMQRQIICDYINSIPLAAQPGYGDVQGLGDGLWAWYRTDFTKATSLLQAPEDSLSSSQLRERARVYRQVLSLMLALRAPSFYLVSNPAVLRSQTDRYLEALGHKGVISAQMEDLALREYTPPRRENLSSGPENFVENKAQNAIRMSLLPLLGINNTYDLDRLDLTVQTTIDQPAQQSITQFLEGIANQQAATNAGLMGYRLLNTDPSKVTYSVTLYERAPGANLLRVQTDNLDQPLNINQSTKLELGSTAKLRTLINYLEIIQGLHKQYAGHSAAQLAKVKILPDDHLTDWAVKYLAGTKDRSLKPMLEAALQRTYSGSTGESFFTGGGVHHFENFESWESGANLSVADAFQNSVNLVFIRLMRDIVYYYRFRVPGASPDVLDDGNDPARRQYLARFADQEGKVYEARFYDKYRGKTPNQSLEILTKGLTALTPLRAAVIFRSIRPGANLDQFTRFLETHLPKGALVKEDPAELYDKYGPDKFNLSDRGYLAHVHPLELWMLNYRERHPDAHLKELWAKSATERQDVYWWLFKTSHAGAQNNRIYTLLEQDAFKEIFKAWKRQGYPFDSLVPSYATTIGVSGDTPAALAQLVGTILCGGMRYPDLRISQLHFGKGTPTETVVSRPPAAGVRVMSPDIAALVRQQLIGVVENGTGKRMRGGILLDGGKVLPVGGKTGTGDNRLESFSAHGGLIGSKAVSRTATFVFFIGDRYFGTILAFVPGSKAASYKFTSALAVQVLKDITPQIKAMIEHPTNKAPIDLLALNMPKTHAGGPDAANAGTAKPIAAKPSAATAKSGTTKPTPSTAKPSDASHPQLLAPTVAQRGPDQASAFRAAPAK